LGEIGEELFNAWKHHPVTKVYLQFLADYAREGHMYLAGLVRTAREAPDPFLMGKLAGAANATADMSVIQYTDMVDFYTLPRETEEQHAA
jgi:hypothetical protein